MTGALEALHPGEFGRIVTEAVLQYRDLELPERVKEVYEVYKAYLEGVTDDIRSIFSARQDEIGAEYDELRDEWQAIRERFATLTAPFREHVESLTERAEAIRERAYDLHGEAITSCQARINGLDSFERPEPELPQEPDGQLYDSRRSYQQQLIVYKRHKAGDDLDQEKEAA